MKNIRSTFILVAGAALLTAGPALAQTTHQTKVDTDTSVSNGISTTTTTQTSITQRTTRQPKKVLGVKVGHKTAVHQTVKKTSVSTNGDSSTTVKTK